MMQELSTLQKCSHAHIMEVMELLEDDEHYYIASELLEGGELFDLLMDVERFSEKDASNIIDQVL